MDLGACVFALALGLISCALASLQNNGVIDGESISATSYSLNGLTSFTFQSCTFTGKVTLTGSTSVNLTFNDCVFQRHIAIEANWNGGALRIHDSYHSTSNDYGLHFESSCRFNNALLEVKRSSFSCKKQTLYFDDIGVNSNMTMLLEDSNFTSAGDDYHVSGSDSEIKDSRWTIRRCRFRINNAGEENVRFESSFSFTRSVFLVEHNVFSGGNVGWELEATLFDSVLVFRGNTFEETTGRSIYFDGTLKNTNVTLADNRLSKGSGSSHIADGGAGNCDGCSFLLRNNTDVETLEPISNGMSISSTTVPVDECLLSADCDVQNTASVSGTAPNECYCVCDEPLSFVVNDRCEQIPGVLMEPTPTSTQTHSPSSRSRSVLSSGTWTRGAPTRSPTATTFPSNSRTATPTTLPTTITKSVSTTNSGSWSSSKSVSRSTTGESPSTTPFASASASASKRSTAASRTPELTWTRSRSAWSKSATHGTSRSKSSTPTTTDATPSSAQSPTATSVSRTTSRSLEPVRVTTNIVTTSRSQSTSLTVAVSHSTSLSLTPITPLIALVSSSLSVAALSPNASDSARRLVVRISGDQFVLGSGSDASAGPGPGASCITNVTGMLLTEQQSGEEEFPHFGEYIESVRAHALHDVGVNESGSDVGLFFVQNSTTAFLTLPPHERLSTTLVKNASLGFVVSEKCMAHRSLGLQFSLLVISLPAPRRSGSAESPQSPPAPIAVMQKNSRVTASVLVTSAGVAGGGTSGAQLARSSLALRMLDCEVVEDSLDWTEAPLAFSLSNEEAVALHISASFMNLILILIIFLMQLAIAVVYSRVRKTGLHEGLIAVRCPSLLVFPVMLLIEPTVMCAVVTVLYAPDSLRILGALSLIMCLLSPAAMVLYLRRRFSAQFVPEYDVQRGSCGGGGEADGEPPASVLCGRRVEEFFFGSHRWIDGCSMGDSSGAGFVRRHRLLFDDYREGFHHFLAAEMLMSCICGILDGLKLGVGNCNELIICLVVVCVIFLLLLLVTRPFSSTFLLSFALLMALLQLTSASLVAMSAFSGRDGNGDGFGELAELSTGFSMLMLSLRAIYDMIPLLKWAMRQVKCLRRHLPERWQRRASRGGRGAKRGGSASVSDDVVELHWDDRDLSAALIVVDSEDALGAASSGAMIAAEGDLQYAPAPCNPHHDKHSDDSSASSGEGKGSSSAAADKEKQLAELDRLLQQASEEESALVAHDSAAKAEIDELEMKSTGELAQGVLARLASEGSSSQAPPAALSQMQQLVRDLQHSEVLQCEPELVGQLIELLRDVRGLDVLVMRHRLLAQRSAALRLSQANSGAATKSARWSRLTNELEKVLDELEEEDGRCGRSPQLHRLTMPPASRPDPPVHCLGKPYERQVLGGPALHEESATSAPADTKDALQVGGEADDDLTALNDLLDASDVEVAGDDQFVSETDHLEHAAKPLDENEVAML